VTEPREEAEAPVLGMLGPRDARILEAFIVTGSLPKAARIVGVDRSTAWRVSRTAVFQAELRRRLEETAQVSRLRLLELQEKDHGRNKRPGRQVHAVPPPRVHRGSR
jgi:hypothetical protein